MFARTAAMLLLSVSLACGGSAAPASPPATSPPAPSSVAAAVAATDRSAEDKALDEGRHPQETLDFFGIRPGMRVAEIASGNGYTAELLARVVGPSGVVYGVNSKFILEKFAEKGWSERLAKPVNKNIVRVDREFDDPLPAEAKGLDAVLDVLFYHDTVWMKTDRARMNAAIFAALEEGGVYGIVDHSARDGAGLADVQTLHRIEKKLVIAEIQQAGFELAGEATFLQNPSDTRDWNASPRAAAERRGKSDRFVLKFVKPEGK
jgi:predicted methyltransferase